MALNDFVGVSVVDPPGETPGLAISVADIVGKQHGVAVTLPVARKLKAELDAALAAAERKASRGRT